MNHSRRIIVLAGRNQVELVRDVLESGNLTLVAAGSLHPDSSGALSAAFNVDRVDDLRTALQRNDADAIWCAEPVPDMGEHWRAARDHAARIITTEPPFTSPGQLDEGLAGASRTWPEFAPRMVRSPGFRAAVDVIAQMGQTLCVNIAFRSGPGEGSLFARLFDAMEVLHALCALAQGVNAALAGPLPGIPESLTGLRGHLTINLRFKTNRCACAALSDSAGPWFRGVTLLTEGGCVRINDAGFVWNDLDGREIDSHRTPLPSSPGSLIAEQLVRRLEELETSAGPPDHAAILAQCEATRLSCLTGQNETPARLLEMLSRP